MGMKRFIVALFVAVTLSACNFGWLFEEEGFDIKGEWVLAGGDFYYLEEDLPVTVIDHFRNGSKSSLNIDGSHYPIETLYLGVTLWTFYPPNEPIDEFWLNNDNKHPYGLSQYGDYQFTVFEHLDTPYDSLQLGGSARPVSIVTAGSDYMTIKIQETVGSANGRNYRYWSILEFDKVASW